jgi:hypothetical protein
MSVLSPIRKLHIDSQYTIKIATYTPGKETCANLKTFSGKYIGWKLKGLESLNIMGYLGLWQFAAFSNCVSEDAERIIGEAYTDNIIGLDTICLLFEDIHVVSTFDPKTQKFMGQYGHIAPFKVSKIEDKSSGTTIYEPYVQMCYISGSGSDAVMNITQNDYLEVELVESDA